jgi:hypothetical protein
MSFGVIRKDSEMLLFPILSLIFSTLFSVAMIVPTFVLDVARQTGHGAVAPLQLISLFASYFGLSFFATFFNVCTVYTTRVRLEGGDATFGQSIAFAFSKVHLIVGWSLVSATVGLLLHALDSIAERAGLLGKILLAILRSILASAWSIMTVFVVPAMVYRDLGPIDAVKDSVATLRQTWGESLIRHYGMGLVTLAAVLPFFLVTFVGLVTGLWPLALFGVFAMVAIFLVFGTANTVFNTALYHFAQHRTAPGFDPEILSSTFAVRS